MEVVDVAAAVDAAAEAGAAADAVNDGLRSLLTSAVPFSADATESAEASESTDSASVAVSACWLTRQLLSPELIACRLPCRSLPCPLFPVDADESADRPLALPMVSAGSGTSVPAPACVMSSSASSVESAESATSLETAVSSESTEVAVSPAEEEFPLAPADRRDAPERELPVLVRDDDMMPLSTIVSVASPSGSVFRLGGAMMSGGWVVRPASSTPSSLVLNGPPMYLCVDTIRDPYTIQTQPPPGKLDSAPIHYLKPQPQGCPQPHPQRRPQIPPPLPTPRCGRVRPRCPPARGSSAARPLSAGPTASPVRPWS